jgi:hypothetical protein
MLIGTDELTIAADCNRTSTTNSEVPSSDNSNNFRVIYSQIVPLTVNMWVSYFPQLCGPCHRYKSTEDDSQYKYRRVQLCFDADTEHTHEWKIQSQGRIVSPIDWLIFWTDLTP